MPRIHKAAHADAERLAILAELTFRETFAAVNTTENMQLHCQASYSHAIQADEISDPKMTTLLCSEGNELIGFAQLRWSSAPSCISSENAGEIQRLYVRSEWHGKGVAQDLMHASLAEMATHGSGLVWLGVWEKNPRAISFYRKFGFVEAGEHIFPLGTDAQRDVVMALRIAP